MKKVPENICEIVAIRHGQTASNRDGIIQGQFNIPLDDLGVRQAEAAARRLSRWQFDAAFSSDLDRAMVTAGTILALQERKQEIFDQVVENPALSAEKFTIEDLKFLLG